MRQKVPEGILIVKEVHSHKFVILVCCYLTIFRTDAKGNLGYLREAIPQGGCLTGRKSGGWLGSLGGCLIGSLTGSWSGSLGGCLEEV